jgi:hypothetical protein
MTDTPDTPDTPDVPDTTETPDAAHPGAPDTPESPGTADAVHMHAPDTTEAPGTADAVGMGAPAAAWTPGTPGAVDIDRRLRSALHTEVDGLRPERGSLDVIRRRGRAARRRRAGVLAGVGLVAVAVAGVLVVPRDDKSGDVATDPAPTPTTEAPGVLTDPERAAAVDDALWPDPAGELFTDPVEAARSFVQVVIGVDDPPMSAFVEGEPGAGEVSVARSGTGSEPAARSGIASVLSLRQLDGEHWFVTGAEQPHYMQIDSPDPLAEVGSPLVVSGQRLSDNGTIVAELRSRSVDAPQLGTTIADAAPGPVLFSVDLPFDGAVGATPGGVPAVLVVHDDPGVDQGVPSFAAQLVRLTVDAPQGESEPPAGPGTTVAAPPAYEFTSQPLWPFRTQDEADAWLATADEGHQPWHAEAEATAQFFTMNYLGFTEIDQIVDSEVRETEAWVHVGYEAEPGVVSTAAVIHLVRFGPSPDAPWEVVGTTDDALTIDTPRYGSPLSSPLIVGGTITGVDESIEVAVRQVSSPEPLGSDCCVPAGGERAWWETTIDVAGATDPAVTVVAWSGGHVQDVEVFAITGLHR